MFTALGSPELLKRKQVMRMLRVEKTNKNVFFLWVCVFELYGFFCLKIPKNAE